jgi:hypothetical protein
MNPTLERRRALFVLFLVIVTYGWFDHHYPRIPNPNETSRLYLTVAMVDDQTLSIDRAIAKYGSTGDRAVRKGKSYCDKAPGLSALAVPGYALAKWILGLFDRELEWRGVQRIARWTAVILPSALFCYFLYLFLGAILEDPKLRLLLVLVYALGSLSRTYGVLFFGHQTSAVLSAGGLMLLWTYGRREGGRALSALLLGAMMLGASFTVEYPTFVTVAVAGALTLYAARPWWRIPLVAALVAAPVALLLLYNDAAFGSPFSAGYAHLPLGFAHFHAKGIFGVTTPEPDALWGILLSPERGLFFFSPWLVAALPGFVFLIARRETRALGIASLTIFAGYVYFASSFSYWIGGDSAGPRHLTPVVPILVFAVAAAMQRLSAAAWSSPKLLLSGAMVFAVLLVGAVSSTFSYFEPHFDNPYREVTLEFWREGAFPESFGSAMGLEGLSAALPAMLPALWSALYAGVAWQRPRGVWAWSLSIGYPLVFALLALWATLTIAPSARHDAASHEAYRYMAEMPLRPQRFGRADDESRTGLVQRGNLAAVKTQRAEAVRTYQRALAAPRSPSGGPP